MKETWHTITIGDTSYRWKLGEHYVRFEGPGLPAYEKAHIVAGVSEDAWWDRLRTLDAPITASAVERFIRKHLEQAP